MSRRHPLTWLEDPRVDTGVEVFDAVSAEFRSYSDLADQTLRTSGGLVAAGVPRGAMVPLLCAPGPDLVGAFYGIQAAGCVVSMLAPPTPMSGTAIRWHIQAVVEALDAEVVVVDDAHRDYLAEVVAETGREVRLLVVERLAEADPARRDPDERALVQFTSGSSGRPRGVQISHDALAANTAAIRAWEGAGPEDSWCSWLPMHHDMGLIGCLVVPVSGNNSLSVCAPETFIRHPLSYLRRFDGQGATITATPAFGLQRVVDKVDHADLAGMDFSHTRAVIVGAERIDPSVVARFTRLLAPHGLDPRSITPAYGLAESTLAVTGVPIDKSPKAVRVRRTDLVVGAQISTDTEGVPAAELVDVISCGSPLPGLDVQVVDVDGHQLPAGHVGELLVTGTSLADGYLTTTSSAGTTFCGHHLRTRDVAFEVEGELYVLGRLGDSVKVNATSLFAEDVEMLLGRAGLNPSRVCVVLGELDSQAHAYAVLEDLDAGAEAIAAEVLATACPGTRRHVAPVPRGSIPRTTSGKSRRHQLWHELTTSSSMAEERLRRASGQPA